MKLQLKEYINLFSKYLKTQKSSVILLSLMLAGNIGMTLINPQITRYFIDEASKGAAVKNLSIAALMFIAVAFLGQLFNIVSTYLGQNIAWKATNDIRMDLIKHCINLDMSFHKEHQPGELIERVDGDVSELSNLFSGSILNILNNSLLLIGILILLFKEGLIIGFSLTLFSILAIYLLGYVKSKTSGHWIKASEANAEFYGFIGEQISSAEDITSCGATKHVMRKFYNLLRKIFPIINKANLTWASMWSVTLIIFALGNIVAFGLSEVLWRNGIITVGTVYLIFNYTEVLRRPIEQIRVNLQELQASGASVIRVNELFNIKSELEDGINNLIEDDALTSWEPLAVEVKNANFSYEDGAQILKDVSVKVKPGRILGIVGHTGSGKTTLARLLVRLYDVDSGEILINNKSIRSITFENLRKNIAYVTQNVQIFTGTVRDNITMFNKDIEDEAIISIIGKMGLSEWYTKFPKGLETMLMNGGENLSAGEAQLIAFIRVFLKNPGLIVLDEATSRIDPITETLIEEALNQLLKNRTCIIIAHRLWTLERADDILILEHGKVLEFGERNELSKDINSQFYKLLQNGEKEVLV